jgi:hypothetical protein
MGSPIATERLYPELPYHIAFFGRVHPRGTLISIQEVRVIHYLDSNNGLILNIVPHVDNSRISIDCYFNPLIDNHASFILPLVLRAILGQIDLISFKLGCGSIMAIDWMKDYNGYIVSIEFAQRGLSSLCTSIRGDESYRKLKSMAASDEAMSLALNDLILAQTMPRHAEINCACAVEGIRHIIVGQGADPKVAWPKMRNVLNVDQAYLGLITDNSAPRRHGQLKPINEIVIEEILRRSWRIMDRFFYYKLREEKPLTISEFPLLVG